MDKTIKLSRTTRFTGRNGYFQSKAITLSLMSHSRELMIIPVTTKDKEARCDISIPVEDIPALIHGMMQAFEAAMIIEANKKYETL